MAYSHNQMFMNEINGETLFDIKKKIDYTKTDHDSRLECVESILSDGNFFEVYVEDCYKVELNQSDALSEDVDVFKTLESMATYLLSSDEEKEYERTHKPLYVFHRSNDKFQKKLNREKSSVTMNGQKVNITDYQEIFHVEDKKKSNYRKDKSVKINENDLKEDSFCGKVLREYQALLDYVDERLAEKKKEKWRTYSNIKGSVKQDMIDAKVMIKGIWSFDGIDSNIDGFDYDIFDFTDYNTVLYMLEQKKNFNENQNMFDIIIDFNTLVDSCDLTIEEFCVRRLMSDAVPISEIAETMDVDHRRIRQTVIPNIVKKIVSKGNKYDAFDKFNYYKIENMKLGHDEYE